MGDEGGGGVFKPVRDGFLQGPMHDVSAARRGGRGQNVHRFKDGGLRSDRPLPANYSPRVVVPLVLSPRYRERKTGPYDWDNTSGVDAIRSQYTTSTMAAYANPMLMGQKPKPAPTRHGLTPRVMRTAVGELINEGGGGKWERNVFGGTTFDQNELPPSDPFAARKIRGVEGTNAEQRRAHLEVALRHEQRARAALQANLMTRLRGEVQTVDLHLGLR